MELKVYIPQQVNSSTLSFYSSNCHLPKTFFCVYRYFTFLWQCT